MKDLTYLEKYRDTQTERDYYHRRGDSGNGAFKVYINGRSFFCVASNGGGWEHVSVSPCNRKRATPPTWAEMCEIKHMFFEDEEAVVQFHPPRREYVNIHPYCLHLWRPTSQDIPRPPKKFV